MKSELIVQDFSGIHNRDPKATAGRLFKGNSWKRQRVIVVLPAGEAMSTKVALSHWNLIFPPNNGVFKMLALGYEVGDAYSKAIEAILAHPDLSTWEYLLTLEHDNAPPPDGVLQLIQDLEERPELSAVGGLYFTKGVGGCAQIWGDPNDPQLNFRPQVPVINGLQQCNGTGMGFTLFRLSMFKDPKLRKPWFVTQKSAQGVGTQDLYFWGDARKCGYRCAIDTRVKVGHHDLKGEYGPPDTMW